MIQGPHGVSPLRQLRNVLALDEGRFVFEAMLSGWADQQSSRGLAEQTISSRERVIRRFEEFASRGCFISCVRVRSLTEV